MKLKLVAVLSLGVALLSVSAFRFVQFKPTVTEDDRLKGSYRFERNGWIYVHLEGPRTDLVISTANLFLKRDRRSNKSLQTVPASRNKTRLGTSIAKLQRKFSGQRSTLSSNARSTAL